MHQDEKGKTTTLLLYASLASFILLYFAQCVCLTGIFIFLFTNTAIHPACNNIAFISKKLGTSQIIDEIHIFYFISCAISIFYLKYDSLPNQYRFFKNFPSWLCKFLLSQNKTSFHVKNNIDIFCLKVVPT